MDMLLMDMSANMQKGGKNTLQQITKLKSAYIL